MLWFMALHPRWAVLGEFCLPSLSLVSCTVREGVAEQVPTG